MGTEQAVLLRRISPLVAVLALLAPPAARATSDAPDPGPGATVLRPDPAPVAQPKTFRQTAAPAPAPTKPIVLRAVVVAPAHDVAVHTRAAPLPVQTNKPVAAKPKPKAKPRAHKRASSLAANFDLPPILGPTLLAVPESSRTPAVLAALALMAAALTAGSGAGLVFSWSRR
jgi:hypothetical protein